MVFSKLTTGESNLIRRYEAACEAAEQRSSVPKEHSTTTLKLSPAPTIPKEQIVTTPDRSITLDRVKEAVALASTSPLLLQAVDLPDRRPVKRGAVARTIEGFLS